MARRRPRPGSGIACEVPFELPVDSCVGQSGSRGRSPAPGPHKSGRARLTHPAPRDTASLREAQGMRKARRGQRVPLLQQREAVPCNERRLGAA